MAMRRSTQSALTLLAGVLLVVAGIVGWCYYVRPLPFDSQRWRIGDPVVRYRMKDALRAKHAAGAFMTREAVDEALGPDDDPGDLPHYRYFRLRAPLVPNPWYVRVTFDLNGKVTRFLVSVD
jgi:hypothetical protein